MAKAKTKKAVKAASTEAGSGIIDSKYREAMKNREPDWVGSFIAKHCTVDDAVSSDVVYKLARANKLNEDSLTQLKKTDANAGRVRMTIGNMLRSAAKQRHGLYGLDGKFYKADAEWLRDKDAPDAPTHDRDGAKLTAKKVAKTSGEAAAV